MKTIALVLLIALALGACSLVPQMNWADNVVYPKGFVVSIGVVYPAPPGTKVWVSLQDNNLNHYPPTSPEWWGQ